MAEAMEVPVTPAAGPVGKTIEWACAAMAALAGLMFCTEAVMPVSS